MWPWGHAAVGYLAYAALTIGRRRRTPTTDETLVVLLATQLPDLIDKPLAWYFDVLPSGRSLGHSLLTAVVLIGVAAVLANRYGRRDLGAPFGVGYLLHVVTDVPSEVLRGELAGSTFLLWPLLPAPTYGAEQGVTAHVLGIDPTPWFLVQIGLFLAVAAVWISRRYRGQAVHGR